MVRVNVEVGLLIAGLRDPGFEFRMYDRVLFSKNL